jgi:hypothetical protein
MSTPNEQYETDHRPGSAAGAIQQAAADATAPAPTSHAEVVVTGAKTRAATAPASAAFPTPRCWRHPASITADRPQQMQDLSIRSTTDAARYDASVSDAYNAVGYAEQFSIRGFKLDNNSATARTASRSRRHPDPAGKQGTHRSAERPGRPAGRRRHAGRHRQLRHQAPDRIRRCAPSPWKSASAAPCTARSTWAAASKTAASATASTPPPNACVPTSRARRQPPVRLRAFDWQISPGRLLQLDGLPAQGRRSPRPASS